MDKISSEEIIKVYDNDKPIWLKSDKWHYYCKEKISEFIFKNNHIIEQSEQIINAGSGGESYNISDEKTIHVDLALSKIKSKPHHIKTNIENIPLKPLTSDLIICVGSVVNYATIFEAIKEFSRLLKIDGYIILEFECSNTLELIGTHGFNASSFIKKTFYRNEEAKIWYYSETWVIDILKEFGFEITTIERWHYISPLILRITGKGNFSYLFAKLDGLIKKIPILNRYCSNAIILAKKRAN